MQENKLNPIALGVTLGILWGFAVLFVGVLNRYFSGYGYEFLRLIASFYPGYRAQSGLTNLPIGVVWALVDGFIGGVLVAWLYNLISKKRA